MQHHDQFSMSRHELALALVSAAVMSIGFAAITREPDRYRFS